MTDLMPCPFCGSENLRELLWCMDEREDDAIECLDCHAMAFADFWNKRPSPWRYPPDMPAEGDLILMTYMDESRVICITWSDDLKQPVRWMMVPDHD